MGGVEKTRWGATPVAWPDVGGAVWGAKLDLGAEVNAEVLWALHLPCAGGPEP
jgi:hypothetical protein